MPERGKCFNMALATLSVSVAVDEKRLDLGESDEACREAEM